MALVSPPTSPILASRICEALLVDEETACEIPIRYGNGRYCNAHGKEYKLLTKAYKEASETVAALKRQASLHRDAVQALKTTQAVEDAIVRVEVWRDAITVEIRGRERHHKRFFRENSTCLMSLRAIGVHIADGAVLGDEGHGQWLESLSREHIKAKTLLADLRVRRQVVVVQEERKRRQHETRRRAEALWRGWSHEHTSMLGGGQALQGKNLLPAGGYRATQPRPPNPAVLGGARGGGTGWNSGEIYRHQGTPYVPGDGYMRASTTNQSLSRVSEDEHTLSGCIVTVSILDHSSLPVVTSCRSWSSSSC
ncbi:hypothetical protein C8Q80DRAFT_348957 [Daedaleopsis nitida]|nr:hypothetical protein C8Q80DRAFT_348957 [Daedaleopsis nitida]